MKTAKKWFQILSIISLCVSRFAMADCQTPLSEGTTFEDLQKKILDCRFNSIEQVIGILPSSYRSNFTLVHHSQSLQGASIQAPRVISFGADAKLILSFNGDPSENRFNAIELIQFREATGKFEARDISFEQSKPVFSAANPARCISCHQTDLRPNWESFPLWPGLYGSQNDSSLGEEASDFQNFVRSSSSNSRYSKLNLSANFKSKNILFTEALIDLNLTRIAKEMHLNSKLSPLRYAILSASRCFDADHYQNLSSSVSRSISNGFVRSLEQFLQDTLQSNHEEFLDRYAYEQSIFPNFPKESTVQGFYQRTGSSLPSSATLNDTVTAGIRWMVENEGVSTSSWSMQAITPGVEFFAGLADGPKRFANTFAKEYGAELDGTAVNAYLNASTPSDFSSACARLKELSLQATTE